MASSEWEAVIGLCVMFFLSLVIVLLLTRVSQLKNELDAGWVGVHDFLARQMNIKYKHAQRFTVLTIVIAYFIIVFYIYTDSPNTNAVIVGSLLGAFPTIAGVTNELMNRPFVVLKDIRVVEYPKKWFVFGSRIESQKGENSLCLHATLENEGREIAEDCKIRVTSNQVDRLSYPTRWSAENEIVVDLHQDEERQADLLWVNSRDGTVSTGSPYKNEDENNPGPNSYNKDDRIELERTTQSFEIEIDAANMRTKVEKVRLNQSPRINIPDDLREFSQEWEVMKSMKSSSGHYAILYDRMGEETLVVPESLDLEYLRRIDDFDASDVIDGRPMTYKEALRDRYTIERVDQARSRAR